MSFLDTIKNAFPSGGGSSDSALGIDIGSSAIKVVQIRKERGRAVLETYGEIALGPYSSTEVGRATHLQTAELTEALKDLMKEANVTATRVGISVPFSSSLTSVIQLPPLPPDRLAQMIPIEARKYIPVAINEVMLDWFVIPKETDGGEWSRAKALQEEAMRKEEKKKEMTEVLLVAIHNDILNSFQQIAKDANLNVGFYELEIFSAVRSSLSHGIAPIMLIDIGAATSKVYIIERGIIRASHLINLGSQDLTLAISRSLGWNFDRAERAKRETGLLETPAATSPTDTQGAPIRSALLSTLGRIFSEANRVLLGYEKKYGSNISKVLLAGGGAGLHGLSEYAHENMSVEVELSQPFAKIQTPAFLDDVLKEVGPEFAVAVGAALRKMQEK